MKPVVAGLVMACLLCPVAAIGQTKVDVGVVRITAPAGVLSSNATLRPEAVVRNFGEEAAQLDVWMVLTAPNGNQTYVEKRCVDRLGPGEEVQVSGFPEHEAFLDGAWSVRCSTCVQRDGNGWNDVRMRTVRVGSWSQVEGWHEMTPIPAGYSGKSVRHGGWVVSVADRGSVYATKGNKTLDFYCYRPDDDNWVQLENVPFSPEKKPPFRGAKACTDGERYIYAINGNNSAGFACYDIVHDAWSRLPDIPQGRRRSKARRGTDMQYVTAGDTGYVYLMVGSSEVFCRYNTVAGRWDTLSNEALKKGAKWSDGSWLVSDGGQTLYAHKARSHRLWTYDLVTGEWTELRMAGMPARDEDGKNRRSKDGGSAVWHEGSICALKGGRTAEFWRFDPGAVTWTRLDDVPEKGSSNGVKAVEEGAGITSFGNGAFLALKGNNTRECWCYRPRSMSSGQAAGLVGSELRVEVSPNPVVAGKARLFCSRALGSGARVKVLDRAGRVVLDQSISSPGAEQLDLSELSAGVYVVRIGGDSGRASCKIVIQP